ncbi:MAG: (Fe-S)-binding protein [Candidatus Methylomirabilales bacterium]
MTAAAPGVRTEQSTWQGVEDCVHCGFCLPTCPTYLALGNEMDSPRGRLYLMRAAAEGRVALDGGFARHMHLCLLCRACETACPSGVRFGHLMESTRVQLQQQPAGGLADRLLRRFILETFTDTRRLRLLLAPLRWYQRSGLQALVHRSGILSRLGRLGTMERLMPQLPAAAAPLPEALPAAGPRRARAGVLLGCAQEAFFPEVNRATARVLAATGFEAVIPRAQGCCGSLFLHEGERERAKALARRLIAAFEAAGVDCVAVNAAGCGSVMKEYGELLHDDPEYATRAAAFSRRVRDVSELLAEAGPVGGLHPVRLTATYHDACHLAHGQRVRLAPRALLQAIPGLRLVELQEADMCCGSAGVYNLLQPGVAGKLLDRKLDRILETGAQVVVSGNPGCLLQIAAGLRRRGSPVRTAHTIELLDLAYRGVGP